MSTLTGASPVGLVEMAPRPGPADGGASLVGLVETARLADPAGAGAFLLGLVETAPPPDPADTAVGTPAEVTTTVADTPRFPPPQRAPTV
jgi:hypothetical protein